MRRGGGFRNVISPLPPSLAPGKIYDLIIREIAQGTRKTGPPGNGGSRRCGVCVWGGVGLALGVCRWVSLP